MLREAITVIAVAVAVTAASAAELSREAIEAATFEDGDTLPPADQQSPLGFKLQVLLDRARISPGILDGYYGMNVEVALRTFAEREGLDSDGQLSAELWDRLGGNDTEALMEYEISTDNVDGPFVEAIPGGFEEMAEMDLLYYSGPDELLAEKFHMHVDVLKQLNPGADFSEAGTEIVVAAVSDDTVIRDDVGQNSGQVGSDERRPTEGKVVRVEVDKEMEQVRGYDSDGKVLVAYPATIGSEATPSPSGTWEVVAVVRDPNYTCTASSGPSTSDSGV